MRARRMISGRWALLALPLAACTAAADAPPALTVTGPERGAIQEEAVVTVRGVVDEGADVRVSVNGLAAEVAPDGAFALTFAVDPGVTVVETVATDAAGNARRDVRAVLAGPLADAGATVTDALGARLGPDALDVVAGVAGGALAGLDLAALAGDGPLVAVGGDCLGAELTVAGVAVGGVDLALAPDHGALAATLGVDDLEVTLRADYRVGCAAHTTPIVIRADQVRAAGALGLAATGGVLEASLADVELALAGLDVEADGLPGELFDLLEGPIAGLAPTFAEAMATEHVPALVEDALAELAGRRWTAVALDRELAITAAPRDVAIAPDGVVITLDGALAVSGVDGARALATPAPAAPALPAGAPGLAVAVSDDALNQALAGVWASGALAVTLPLERGDPLLLLFGQDVRALEVTLALPPTVAIDPSGDLRLVVGDAIVRCADEAGGEVARIAVSLSTTVGAELVDGARLAVRLGEPRAWAQVLAQAPAPGDDPFDGDRVEELIAAVWPILAAELNQVLAAVPVPSLAGVTVTDAALTARGGFLVLDTTVAAE